jgi:hypothetical protein
MTLSLNERVLDRLKANPGEKYTAKQLAESIFQFYPKECAENRKFRKKVYTTDAAFIAQLAAEIGAHRKYLDQNIKYEGSPLTYLYQGEESAGGAPGQMVETTQGITGFSTARSRNSLNSTSTRFSSRSPLSNSTSRQCASMRRSHRTWAVKTGIIGFTQIWWAWRFLRLGGRMSSRTA